MSDDFFADLDAEIAAVLSKSKLKKESEAARKRANNMHLSTAARAQAKAQWLEAEAILEADRWESQANVALFTEQHCDGCGSSHRLFVQYMERQVSKTSKVTRWVRLSALRYALPREVLSQSTITHICASCADDHDFYLEEARPFSTSGLVLPSPTYNQADINALENHDGQD